MSYLSEAMDDAADTVDQFEDEIIDLLVEQGEADDDITSQSYDEEYHHQSHVDKSYSFDEAAALIGELDEYEETDTGLWEGCDFKRSAETCAAFTYGNAVRSQFTSLIKEINDEINVDEIKDAVREELKDARRAQLETKVEAELTYGLDDGEKIDSTELDKQVADRLDAWIEEQDTAVDKKVKEEVKKQLRATVERWKR